MAGNTQPIFSRIGSVQWSTKGAILAAANDLTGVSTNNEIIFTADATNGSFVQGIRWKHAGTNIATVARVYINNSSGTTVAGNNTLITEQMLPAITASTAASMQDIYTPLNNALGPGQRILTGLGTSVASGWFATVFGGNY